MVGSATLAREIWSDPRRLGSRLYESTGPTLETVSSATLAREIWSDPRRFGGRSDKSTGPTRTAQNRGVVVVLDAPDVASPVQLCAREDADAQ